MLIPPINKFHSRYFHLKYAREALGRVKGNGSAGSPPKVLDVGCGKGGITANLKKEKPKMEFFACDNDSKALAFFDKNYKELGIKLKKCDAQNLPYKRSFFDAVVMFDVLEHLENPQHALSEIKRVLKIGGVFHLVVPLEADMTTFDGWIKRFFGKNLKKKPIGHIHQFTSSQIQEMLKDLGLKVQREKFSYHFSYQLFSLIYYLYVAIFRRGEYLSLSSDNKPVNNLLTLLGKLGGWLVFLESSLLSGIRGQTIHISAKK